MKDKKTSGKGLTNRAALAVIALGYPIGMIGWSLVYISSVNDTFWDKSAVSVDQNEGRLSKKRARKIVEDWWVVRNFVFGSPYDRNKAVKVVAKGPLWNTLNVSKSPISWLKANGRSQEYKATIKKVTSFDAEVEKPRMVAVIEYTTSLKGGSQDLAKAKTAVKSYEIVFAYEQGTWKIWDYKALK